MGLSLRKIGKALGKPLRAVVGGPVTIGNVWKQAAGVAIGEIPVVGTVAQKLAPVTKFLDTSRSVAGALSQPSVGRKGVGGASSSTVAAATITSGVASLSMAGGGGFTRPLANALRSVRSLTSGTMSAAPTAALSSTLSPFSFGAKPVGIAPINQAPPQQPQGGIYDRIDQVFGGWLPGGTYGPGGGFNGFGSGAMPVAPGGAAAGVLSGQVPIVTAPQTVTVQKAPQGYVLITGPQGQRVAMLKQVAYALGFKKRPTKRGGISGKEISSARRVQRLLMEMTTGRKPKSPLTKGRKR